jgi:hypothetical protein
MQRIFPEDFQLSMGTTVAKENGCLKPLIGFEHHCKALRPQVKVILNHCKAASTAGKSGFTSLQSASTAGKSHFESLQRRFDRR